MDRLVDARQGIPFMISIIVPAHNESSVIARTVSALTTGALAGEMEVIVVCNGCIDDTADRARQAGGNFVRVIETDIASKSHALNLGDQAAIGFPRFYVDADVILNIDAMHEVSRRLQEQPAVLAAAPQIEFNLNGCSWAVRAFYEVWSALPYCRSGMIGSGVYALSEAGRRRFDQFPDIIADDAFVRLQFKPAERATIESCLFTVSPPKTLRKLIDIKIRAYFGDYELRSLYPYLRQNKQDGHGKAIAHLCRKPSLWPKIGVYFFVRLTTRLLAYKRFYVGDHRKWERDDTSRIPVGVLCD
jgi:glycosyltransferase involved in cell wall biosynthesis